MESPDTEVRPHPWEKHNDDDPLSLGPTAVPQNEHSKPSHPFAFAWLHIISPQPTGERPDAREQRRSKAYGDYGDVGIHECKCHG